MNDERLREAPELPKGAVLRPLDCRGPGSHDPMGYRCANAGLDGCLNFVCKRCASKQSAKPYTEVCGVCALAETLGSSMPKALAKIAELHPESLVKGKVECAAVKAGARPCRKCVRHKCKQCERDFRNHSKRGDFCGDLCRRAVTRESNRQRQERHRQNKAAA